MKFIIVKEELEKSLAIAQKAISGKNPRVILTGIKMELNANGLFLTTSDSYISIVTKIPLIRNEKDLITIVEKGTCVIGARQFIEIIKKLEGSRIEIEMVENNVIKIKDDISDFSLNCFEVEDYPSIDFVVQGSSFTLNSKDFVDAVNETSYAASDKDTRPVLQGVNIRCNGNNIEWVATDGFRIAKRITNIEEDAHFSVTIPAKILSDISKIGENDKNISVVVSDKKAIFKFTNTLVAAGIINNPYPDTSRLFPSSCSSKLTINSNKLIASIDRISTLSADRNAIVKFVLSENEVRVMARTQETGSGNDLINDFVYAGDRLEISFTSRYVVEAAKAIGGETICISFNGDEKAAVLQNANDGSAIALILPVKTY